jgi:hypothetical protein
LVNDLQPIMEQQSGQHHTMGPFQQADIQWIQPNVVAMPLLQPLL